MEATLTVPYVWIAVAAMAVGAIAGVWGTIQAQTKRCTRRLEDCRDEFISVQVYEETIKRIDQNIANIYHWVEKLARMNGLGPRT